MNRVLVSVEGQTEETFVREVLSKDLWDFDELQNIRRDFPTPEDINDNPMTAPSKRILALYPRYEKPLYGIIIALEVGLDSIRSECPHFSEWLAWLESLG